ncbi:hypothetical protein BDN70DRAFT_878205 [Pholiota conissans]|uniref:F-box domain-containing protein n=1 Tax=Pholiota conissans TaxID=109636 RepID=A0A9P5Z453_9AGAR|nr:hypothetical protein BDN70DRAFT_878205 [Pholiota conissans]
MKRQIMEDSSSSSEDEGHAHGADLAHEKPFPLDDSLLALVSATPPAKKAKLSPSHQPKSAPSKKATRRPQKTLSLLPTMPLDIIYEILSFLTPKDLLTMAKVNKLFRKTLLSPQATTVWKSSRERSGGPRCPSDINELDWAILLFGDACQSCGTPRIRKVDFHLRCRVCARCKRRNVLAKSRFKIRFPDEHKSVLDLLPSTSDNGDAMGSFHSNRGCSYYWISDIEDIVRQLGILEANITKGIPDAEQALETFKERRVQLVQSIKNDVSRLTAWKADAADQRQQDRQSEKDRRKNEIINRMIQLGYSKADLADVEQDFECNRAKQLTERVWARIRPALEAKADTIRTRRLISEREALVVARRSIVKTLYMEYKASLSPSQWKYLPRVLDICEFDCFKTLVEADSSIVVEKEDFKECMEMLPGLLARRMDDLKGHLMESMERSITDDQSANVGSTGGKGKAVMRNDLVDLAIATFQCEGKCRNYTITRSARLVIGWDTIATHYCEDENEGLAVVVRRPWDFSTHANESGLANDGARFTFDVRASVVARELVRCAGLEEERALASEMDAKNLRYGCKTCGVVKISIEYGLMTEFRVGYGWRDAVYHSISNHLSSSNSNGWRVLPEDEIEKVIAKESRDAKWAYALYTCGHCAEYMTRQATKGSVISHLRTMHGIENPQSPDDYFFYERYHLLFNDESQTYETTREFLNLIT